MSPDEQCDDGNSIDTDLCTSSCMMAVCGDSIPLNSGIYLPSSWDFDLQEQCIKTIGNP